MFTSRAWSGPYEPKKCGPFRKKARLPEKAGVFFALKLPMIDPVLASKIVSEKSRT